MNNKVVPVTDINSEMIIFIVVDKVMCLVQDGDTYHVALVTAPTGTQVSRADGDNLLKALGQEI
jgi:hypothetical protein